MTRAVDDERLFGELRDRVDVSMCNLVCRGERVAVLPAVRLVSLPSSSAVTPSERHSIESGTPERLERHALAASRIATIVDRKSRLPSPGQRKTFRPTVAAQSIPDLALFESLPAVATTAQRKCIVCASFAAVMAHRIGIVLASIANRIVIALASIAQRNLRPKEKAGWGLFTAPGRFGGGSLLTLIEDRQAHGR